MTKTHHPSKITLLFVTTLTFFIALANIQSTASEGEEGIEAFEDPNNAEAEDTNEGATPADPLLLASIGEALMKGAAKISSFAQRATSRERRSIGMMEIVGPLPAQEP